MQKKLVICPFVEEDTDSSYPFENGLNKPTHLGSIGASRSTVGHELLSSFTIRPHTRQFQQQQFFSGIVLILF